MDILKYLKPNGNHGIIGRILANVSDEDEKEKKGTAISEALTSLETAETPMERAKVMSDYVKAGYDPREVQAAQAAMQAPKQDYSGMRSVNGGLYDLQNDSWKVPPKEPAPKSYKPPMTLRDNVLGYADEKLGVVRKKDGSYEDSSGNPLDPGVEDQLSRRASEIYQETGDADQAMQDAYAEIVGGADNLEATDKMAQDKTNLLPWNWGVSDKPYMRPKGAAPTNSITTGKVRVSNGTESFLVSPEDLEAAKRDGYRQIGGK